MQEVPRLLLSAVMNMCQIHSLNCLLIIFAICTENQSSLLDSFLQKRGEVVVRNKLYIAI